MDALLSEKINMLWTCDSDSYTLFIDDEKTNQILLEKNYKSGQLNQEHLNKNAYERVIFHRKFSNNESVFYYMDLQISMIVIIFKENLSPSLKQEQLSFIQIMNSLIGLVPSHRFRFIKKKILIPDIIPTDLHHSCYFFLSIKKLLESQPSEISSGLFKPSAQELYECKDDFLHLSRLKQKSWEEMQECSELDKNLDLEPTKEINPVKFPTLSQPNKFDLMNPRDVFLLDKVAYPESRDILAKRYMIPFNAPRQLRPYQRDPSMSLSENYKNEVAHLLFYKSLQFEQYYLVESQYATIISQLEFKFSDLNYRSQVTKGKLSQELHKLKRENEKLNKKIKKQNDIKDRLEEKLVKTVERDKTKQSARRKKKRVLLYK